MHNATDESMAIETDRAKIVRCLERDGWVARHGGKHDVYTNPAKPEVSIVVPRHRTLSGGVARGITKDAGWI